MSAFTHLIAHYRRHLLHHARVHGQKAGDELSSFWPPEEPRADGSLAPVVYSTKLTICYYPASNARQKVEMVHCVQKTALAD
jgi:hypothetical protein